MNLDVALGDNDCVGGAELKFDLLEPALVDDVSTRRENKFQDLQYDTISRVVRLRDNSETQRGVLLCVR